MAPDSNKPFCFVSPAQIYYYWLWIFQFVNLFQGCIEMEHWPRMGYVFSYEFCKYFHGIQCVTIQCVTSDEKPSKRNSRPEVFC